LGVCEAGWGAVVDSRIAEAGDASIRFCVLGPLRAYRGNTELTLGWPRQRAVLAVLLLRPGQVVSRDELIDAVWGTDPPATAANVVHAYIAGLRRTLEPGRGRREPGKLLASASPGYVLRLPAERLDHAVAARHLADARREQEAGELKGAVAAFDAALALWQGIPLAGVPGPLAELERARLAELRLSILEDRADTMLHLGMAAGLIGQLRTLVAENPFRERLAGLLMLALVGSGRQAEALAAYQRARQLLVEQLGVEPGQDLQRLHDDILHSRVTAAASRPDAGGRSLVVDTPVVPRQLPLAVPRFTGRRAELKALSNLAGEVGRSAGTSVIATICGTAGVGKTALVLHWAHDVAERFPDGQLYVNLRGFDPAGKPVKPGAAIRGFLRAFAVPARRIPNSLEEQVGLYRSLLADKRVLVVLDDARDEDQVRPLLPGSSLCMVIVTSRSQLTGLAVGEGAHVLTLGVFTAGEARELLASRLGQEPIAAEPHAVAELIVLCAHLPLALSVVAARAAVQPKVPLAAFAAELRDTYTRLDTLNTGDVSSDVRAAFCRSYQGLAGLAARMFRLLGLHPGPDISVPAAASMAGIPGGQAAVALRELARFHLATEHAPGRFTLHDLLRAYAAEQAATFDSEGERRAAIHRMLDHYLHTARAGAVLLHPARDEVTPAPAQPGVVPEYLANHGQALAWYEAEHAVLLAVIARAADVGFDTHAWQLPWTLVTFLYRTGRWHEWTSLQRSALEAAERIGDYNAQARSQLDSGYACVVRACYDGAHRHLRQALGLFRQLDDEVGQARAHNALAMAFEGQGRHSEALDHAKRSLDLYTAAGNPAAQANALTELGWLQALLGDYHQALNCCQQALDLHRGLGNRHGEAAAWASIGYTLHCLGRRPDAITCHQRALTLYRELGDRHHQAGTLTKLGDSQYAAGNHQAARNTWQQALTILDSLHHPDATQIQARLSGSVSLNLTRRRWAKRTKANL
jgi:DNA-binding SARP family transcriptional activator/tetratricopeptide (TPR) repeat protein